MLRLSSCQLVVNWLLQSGASYLAPHWLMTKVEVGRYPDIPGRQWIFASQMAKINHKAGVKKGPCSKFLSFISQHSTFYLLLIRCQRLNLSGALFVSKYPAKIVFFHVVIPFYFVDVLTPDDHSWWGGLLPRKAYYCPKYFCFQLLLWKELSEQNKDWILYGIRNPAKTPR